MITLQVIDVITASTNDMGPLSLDTFRKNNLSASWKVGVDTSVLATFEVKMSSMLLEFLLMIIPFEILFAKTLSIYSLIDILVSFLLIRKKKTY